MIITYGLIISSPDFPHSAFTARVSCDDLHDTSTPSSNFPILIMAGQTHVIAILFLRSFIHLFEHIGRDSLLLFFKNTFELWMEIKRISKVQRRARDYFVD